MAELRIKEILSEKGMTQEELAQMIGVTAPYVNSICNGGKGASINKLFDIARALNVPLASLFADYMPIVTPVEQKCPHCGKPIRIRIE